MDPNRSYVKFYSNIIDIRDGS